MVVVLVVLLVGIGVVLFRPLLGLLIVFVLAGSRESVVPSDAPRSVASSLMDWRVVGNAPNLAQRMTGINGFSESSGFHGDGTDWYEIELSPDLVAELRAGLAQSTAVTKSRHFPKEDSAPPWWPKTWPADAQCYEKDFRYLVLPDTGTRAWFLRIRM